MQSDPEWRANSRCRKLSPQEADQLFFVGKGGKTNKAQEYCMGCPVRTMCIPWAAYHGLQGFYGGLTEKERETFRASHPDSYFTEEIVGKPNFTLEAYIAQPRPLIDMTEVDDAA